MRASSLFAAILGFAFALGADEPLPPELQGVGVEEHLGRAIDLNLTFTAENGYPVALRDYFHKGRPVVLNLVYYSCPMLCNMVLNGQTAALKEIPWTAGSEFEVVTISIDPDGDLPPRPAEARRLSRKLRPPDGGLALSYGRSRKRKAAGRSGRLSLPL